MSKPRTNGNRQVGSAKRQEFVEKMSSFKLLGNIITWNPGSSHPHAAVVAALKTAGLDEKVAKEFQPRHAFTRAARKLVDNQVIDQVNEDSEGIKFQLTKKFLQEGEWSFEKETFLELNKTTGKITCPVHDIEHLAQDLLDKAMDARTTADISSIIQTLFEANADLFPIRDQGGAYFVPQEHHAFVIKIKTFLEALGGKLNPFPIPANTEDGDKSVQDTIKDSLESLITDHKEAIASFGVETRGDTLKNIADKINKTKTKIEAYAQYLASKKDDLLAHIEETNQELLTRIQNIAEEKKNLPQEEGNGRFNLFGHPISAILRWMASQKPQWTEEEARLVLNKMGFENVKDKTISGQFWGIRSGCERYKAAPELKKEETKQLFDTLKEIRNAK